MSIKHVEIQGQKRHLGGWWKDSPDHRDLLYQLPARRELPTRVDLRQFDSAIEDQGSIGSCTAHASTSAMEFLYKKLKSQQAPHLSRLFVYWMTRVNYERVDPTDDSGAEIRNVVKELVKYGTCFEVTWPYIENKFSDEPSVAAKQEALNHQVLAYRRVADLNGIKNCLFEGYPVIFGFSVPESGLGDGVSRTGMFKLPGPDEGFVGGHAVLAMGYDDVNQCVIVKNSWGTAWGSHGYGFIPYGFFVHGLANDFWTIRREEM